MDIAKLGSHPIPVGPEIENAAVKPPSPGTPRETSETGNSDSASAQPPSQANVSKRPLDDPALKTVLSEKLGGGSGYSGPQIRMDRNIIGDDGGDDGGSDAGPDAPSGDGWGVSKNDDPKSLNSNDGNIPKSGDDNNGPTRGVGFTFTGRPGREGDGHTNPSGATGTSSSTSSTSSNTSSSSSSSSSGTSSSTSVHPQKK